MISLEDFTTALGTKAQTMSQDQIEQSRILHDQLADVLFDVWLEKKNKQKN